FERLPWIDSKAAVLALCDHQPSCQRIPKLCRQRQPPLVVELGRVGAEEHAVSSCHTLGTPRGSDVRHFTPQSPTLAPILAIRRVSSPLVPTHCKKIGTIRLDRPARRREQKASVVEAAPEAVFHAAGERAARTLGTTLLAAGTALA